MAIAYLDEERDAEETRRLVEEEGSEALLLGGDLADRAHATDVVRRTVERFGTLDVLVNEAATQWSVENLREIDEKQLRETFDSNVMAVFFVTQAALEHLGHGSATVNTTSVNAFRGNAHLVDYSATRGATLAFSHSMALQLVDKGIRINGVAPGPIWTPFIPGGMPAEKVEGFGSQSPMDRAGQSWEVAPSFLFLACEDSSYMTGQTLRPNGGSIVGA